MRALPESNEWRLGLGYFTAIALAAALSIISIFTFHWIVSGKDSFIYQRADHLIQLKSLEALAQRKVARNRAIAYLVMGDTTVFNRPDLDQQFDSKLKELAGVPEFKQLGSIQAIADAHDEAVKKLQNLRAQHASSKEMQQYFETNVRPLAEKVSAGVVNVIDREMSRFRNGVMQSVQSDRYAIRLLYLAGIAALLLSIGLIVLFTNTMKRFTEVIRAKSAAQKAAEESEREFRAIFEASGVGIAQVDLINKCLIRVNSGYCEMVGYDEGELLHRSPLEFTHPEDQNEDINAFEELGSGRLKSYFTNKRYIRKDGQVVWASLTCTVCKWDESGRPIEGVTTIIDISRSKESEESLAKAKEAAEEANRAKSWFLANVSHEIRSPMNAVLGYADLLSEKSGITEAEKLIYARRIKNSGEHLLRLINDILDLSKVEAGQIKIEEMNFDMVDLVEECLQSLSVIAQGKGIRLQLTQKSKFNRRIQSDPARIRQILVNLIGNAIKFTEKGFVNVSLELNEASATPQLIVSVEDSGVGISSDKQEKLFRPFNQLDNSVTRKYGGTGLGLHLSKRFAKLLGGSLELSWSCPSRGSCFTLAIPVGVAADMAEEPKVLPMRTKTSVLLLKGMQILLVDDSADNQILMKIFLENAGASVELAKDGGEAIEKALSGNYDLLLMDVMMPVVDGLEATRRLRERGYDRPIVAVSAHALREEVDRSLAAGCNDHLSKPVSCAKLVTTAYRYSVEAALSSI